MVTLVRPNGHRPRRDTCPPPAVSLLWDNLRLALVAKRERLGLSQSFLSQKLGRSRSQVTEWENGTHTPSVECLLVWCRTLGFHLRAIEMDVRPRRLVRAEPEDETRAA